MNYPAAIDQQKFIGKSTVISEEEATVKPGLDYFLKATPKRQVFQPYVNSKITNLLTDVDQGNVDLKELRMCQPLTRTTKIIKIESG